MTMSVLFLEESNVMRLEEVKSLPNQAVSRPSPHSMQRCTYSTKMKVVDTHLFLTTIGKYILIYEKLDITRLYQIRIEQNSKDETRSQISIPTSTSIMHLMIYESHYLNLIKYLRMKIYIHFLMHV